MKRTKQERIRLGVLFVLVGLFFSIATARLVHLQVFQASRYADIVGIQSSATIPIPAERGTVFDRNGTLVAKNVITKSLYAYPRNKKELNQVADYLERFFALKHGSAVREYNLRVMKFSWIKRRLPDEIAHRIEEDAPQGLALRNESQRAYPFGDVGKQVLGFTDIDNIGQSGLELSYNSELSGRPGTADVWRDGLQNIYRVKETALVKPEPGKSSVITVDWRLQEIVQQEIRATLEEYNAKSAMAVFVDCRTGDILAAAHYDPKEKHPSRPTKLRAITDQFEPGSVFKAFTASKLIDADLVNFTDSVYCEMGRWPLGRRTLHDDKKLGWLDFRHVIELSSNIGMAKFAMLMPPEELFEGYRRFGFGQKLRCGLPGETQGRLVRPGVWSDYNIAALAMGHSMAASPLQLAIAMGAVANGGKLMEPRLLLGWLDDDDRVVPASEPRMICRASEESSMDSLHAILRGVVQNGTAAPVNSPVVSIAGKTGTAEIPDLINGGYYKNQFNASFLGFFPYESPLVAGIVVMEDPKPITYGGHTAGRAFRNIAEGYAILKPDAFVSPERLLLAQNEKMENLIEAPDLIGRDVSGAIRMASDRGINLRCSAKEGKVAWQFPPADRILFDGDQLIVTLEPTEPEKTRMTDLRGLSIRAVAAYLHRMGVKYRINGVGRVVRQSIKPGSVISVEMGIMELVCRRT